MKKPLKVYFIILALIACQLLYTALSKAQDEPAEGKINSRAYVPISADAVKLIETGLEAAKNSDWTNAVKKYQEAMEKYPENIVPYPEEPNTFVGVKYLCRQLLSNLPAEGKKTYRDIFDPSARTLLETAQTTGDQGFLNQLVERYLYTSYGIKSTYLSALSRMEKEEFDKAGNLLETITGILKQTDSKEIPMNQVLAFRAICYSRLRQIDRLQTLYELILKDYPEMKILKHDSALLLADFAKGELAKLKSMELAVTGDWDTYGGDNRHSKTMGSRIETQPPLMWSFDIPSNRVIPSNIGFSGQLLPQNRYLPYFPSVHNGILYLGTETAVYALNLITLNEGKQPDIIWKVESGFFNNPVYEERAVFPITVSQDKVFANLITSTSGGLKEQIYPSYYLDVKYPFPHRTLFALNASNGKIIWSAGEETDKRDFFKKASFPMPPVVDYNCVYAVAVYNENDTDLPQQYLCSFNASTGELYWKTFVTSGILEVNLFNNPAREIMPSMVTVDDDSIYYSSNVGVISAVDKHTGMIKWVKKYNQMEITVTRGDSPVRLPLLWANNPLIKTQVSDKHILIATPIDSNYLYALDGETGKELWQWEGSPLSPVRYVLGIKNNILYLEGENSVIGIDISKEGKRAWTYENQFKGKGGLTDQSIYLPARNALMMFDLATKKLQASWEWNSFPNTGVIIDPNTTPPVTVNVNIPAGNILISDNVLIIIAEGTVNAFYDWSGMETWFKRQLKEKPDDAYLIQQIGTLALKNKKYSEAVSLFKQGLSAAEKNPNAGQLTNIINNHLHRTYFEWAKSDEITGTNQAVDCLEKARAYSPGPYSFVETTLELVQAYQKSGQWENTVREYQLLIEKMPDETYNGERIWDFARLAIDSVITKIGSTVYEKQEQKARTLYEVAKSSADRIKLMAIYKLYPNSRSAEDIIYNFLESAYQKQDYADATENGMLFIKTFSSSAHLLPVYLKLAESYEKTLMFGTAKTLLKKMLKIFPPDTVITIQNKQLSLKEYVKTKLDSPEYAYLQADKQTLKPFSPPLKLKGSHTNTESETVSLNDQADFPSGNSGNLILIVEDKIIGLDSDAKISWTKKTGLTLLPSAFRVSGKIIALSREAIAAYDAPPPTETPDNGVSPKQSGVGSSRGAERSAPDWFIDLRSKSEILVRGELWESHLFLITQDSKNPMNYRLTVFDISNGKELWSFPFADSLLDTIIIYDEEIILPVFKNITIVLDKSTGKMLNSVKPENNSEELRNYHYDQSGKLYLFTTLRIIAYDIDNKKILWKSPTPADILPETVKANETHLFFFTTRENQTPDQPMPQVAFELNMLERATGKPTASGIKCPVYISDIGVDERMAYIIALNEGNSNEIQISGHPIKNTLELKEWKETISLETGTASTVSQVLFTDNHIIINVSAFNPDDKKWLPIIMIFDKITGKEIQKIEGELKSSGQPEIRVIGDRLCVIQDNTIYLYH
ncbi:MAG: PQQ-binding-like beta-propeller repeat protein [Planctomycetes bacterium]|nr:PQQ-binding-like beta-propeller repeat protein [Planctomycetota bacterium]